MCEIIDVLTPCWNLKNKLVDGGKPINSGLTFNLEQIVDSLDKVQLENQGPTEKEWKAFAELFSNAIKIHKLSLFQSPVATYGADWLKEVNTSSLNGKGKTGKITNPFQYWITVANNGDFGFSCTNGETAYRQFFEECEQGKNMTHRKISHVLKSSYSGGSAGGKHRIPKKDGGGSWLNQHEMTGPLKSEFKSRYNEELLIQGIVEEDCENLKTSAFFMKFPGPASKFCHEINKLFFGNTVDEKLEKSTLFTSSPFLPSSYT